mgnify:CR=1 FL=1
MTLEHDFRHMTQSTLSFDLESIPIFGWLAIALVFTTGLFHIYAGLVEGRIPVALAGIGFFAAMGLYLMNYRRRQLYLVGILYTTIQIPLWYMANAGEFTTIGYADKTVQVVLIGILAYMYWQTNATTENQDASSRSEQPY